MTKIIITTVMALLALATTAQVSEVRETQSFSKIEVQSGIELVYTQSEEFSIKREAMNVADLKNITTEVNGKTLKIYYSQKGESETKGKTLKVYINANNINSFKAISNAKIIFRNTVNSKEMTIDLASGASFTGLLAKNEKTKIKACSGAKFSGSVDTDYLQGDFKSGAAVCLAGNAKKVVINTSSGAFCTAKNLVTDNASVNAVGLSSIQIRANGKINISADANSSIVYFGDPKEVSLAQNSFSIEKKTKKNPVLIAME